MSREAISPMPRNARVAEHHYVGMTSAEMHRAALDRVEHYSGTPPDPELARTWAMLRGAWEWVAERHR